MQCSPGPSLITDVGGSGWQHPHTRAPDNWPSFFPVANQECYFRSRAQSKPFCGGSGRSFSWPDMESTENESEFQHGHGTPQRSLDTRSWWQEKGSELQGFSHVWGMNLRGLHGGRGLLGLCQASVVPVSGNLGHVALMSVFRTRGLYLFPSKCFKE